MPVEHFIEGCELFRSMLPSEAEVNLAKIINSRLIGEARRSIQDQDFSRINRLTSFFKSIFGSTKSLLQLQVDFARNYQEANESVLTYANKTKAIGKRILEAHRIANNGVIC